MRFVCTLFSRDASTVSAFVCAHRLVHVCSALWVKLGNRINSQPHNENDPQQAVCTHFPFIIHMPAAIKVCGCV